MNPQTRRDPCDERRAAKVREERKLKVPQLIKTYYVLKQQWGDIDKINITRNQDTGYEVYSLRSIKFNFHHVWTYSPAERAYLARNGFGGSRNEDGKWVPDIVAKVS